MVPGELFLMDGFQKGAPCPGQSKGKRKRKWQINYLALFLLYLILRNIMFYASGGQGGLFLKKPPPLDPPAKTFH
jgi:hypothetical protein